MSMINAIDAEVAYRQERVAEHFRPWRRVGAERRHTGVGRAEQQQPR